MDAGKMSPAKLGAAAIAATPRTRDVPPVPGSADGRTRRARLWRTIFVDLRAQLGHAPDRAELALLLDAAGLALELQTLGARSDVELRMRLSHALGESLRRLGLQPQRQPEPERPSFVRLAQESAPR
jgi:hypothetical protein